MKIDSRRLRESRASLEAEDRQRLTARDRAAAVARRYRFAWFSRQEGPRRCVVRFTDFLADLEGTMAKVYRECLDVDELPAHVPRAHPPRERTTYLLNRSLHQAGIDEAEFSAAQLDFITWMSGPR